MPRTAIVGAGVVGLLTAWELRRTGHAVTIIDPDVGRHASHAAAGMLAPVSEVQYGQQELWPIMTAARGEYRRFVERLERAAGIPAGYRENGTVLIAADRSDREAVGELVTVQQAHGMQVEALTGTQLRRREPALAPGLSKGWDVPGDHQVDPRQLVRCAVAALNADVHAAGHDAGNDAGPPAAWIDQRVTRIDAPQPAELPGSTDAGPYTLTLDDGDTRTAEQLMIVPGLGHCEIDGLPSTTPLDLRPIHGDVIRLRVTGSQLLDGETQLLGATVRATVAGRSVYLVPRADGEVVVGASSREDRLAGTHTGSVQELLDDAVAILPAVKEMELTEITTRARPGTPDERPYLGALEGHADVVVSTGYSRHGILLAPLAARLGAALLNGETIEPEDRAMLEHMSLARRCP